MKNAVLAMMLLLGGCVGLTEVNRIGKDTYMVGASSQNLGKSPSELTQAAIARANLYCQGLGKEMVLSSSTVSGIQKFTPLDSQIQFKCLSADDPEYQGAAMHR